MSFLLLNLVAGLMVGAFFRVQTLIALAALVLIEAIWQAGTSSLAFVVLWSFAAESSLQLGYLAGVFVRNMVERSHLAFRFTKGYSGPSPR